MYEVFIFGSGSSVEFGIPLTYEVYEKAHVRSNSPLELSKSKDSQYIKSSLGEVKKILKDIYPNLSDNYSEWPNFEETITFLNKEKRNKELGEFENLIFSLISSFQFESELGEKYNEAKAYKEFVKREIMRTNKNIIFISLNYDLLLDWAIEELTEKDYSDSTSFISDFTYGIELFNENNNRCRKDGILLLKPHGSLNIMGCSKCNKYFWRKDSWYISHLNKRANCPECKINMNVTNLLPPVYEKSNNSNLRKLIDKYIVESFSKATEIHIIGYSFPAYDLDMKNLLLKGVGQNPCKKGLKFNIIDKFDNAKKLDIERKHKPIAKEVKSFGGGFLDYINKNEKHI